MLSRRALVGKIAAGLAGSAVAWAATSGRANATARKEASLPVSTGDGAPAAGVAHQVVDAGPAIESAPPWELLRPLTTGTVVAHGWRVAGLSGVVDGSCVLTLQNQSGRTHRVHLCENAGRPQGLVHTQRFDLVVMNGGLGDLPTEEGLAQAIAEVAHVVAANEKRTMLTALLPHAERVKLFAGPADRRLR